MSVKDQVAWAKDAGGGIEYSRFEGGGKLANVARPGVLEKARQGSLGEDCGGLLVVAADAVDKCLGDWGDVFAMLLERREGKADSGEAEGEVG